VKVNGKSLAADPKPGGYLAVRRKWTAGDTIELNLPMAIRLMEARPEVKALKNYVSVMRGPIVYCLELPESQGGAKVWRDGVFLPENVKFTVAMRKDFLGGGVVLSGQALTANGRDRFIADTSSAPEPKDRGRWGGLLYRRFEPRGLPIASSGRVQVTLIPYYAWANRGASLMEVWIPLAR
jgi:hypothetical protein